MDFWTPDTLALVTDGHWLVPPGSGRLPLVGLTTDSRAALAGAVFLALPGKRYDGHDFLGGVAAAGAAMAIVSDAARARASLTEHPTFPCLVVPDTLVALQQLAASYRAVLARGGCQVIAVAGSNGKTTTRHLIFTALQGAVGAAGQPLRGTQSPKSFNNHIGVPLSLLAARPEDDFVALEIGTNHPGEIAALAALARPDLAVITSLGREHLEHFGSIEGVAREEAEILRFVAAGGEALIEVEAWQQLAALELLPVGLPVHRYGRQTAADDSAQTLAGTLAAALPPAERSADEAGTQPLAVRLADGTTWHLTLPLLGRHNAVNALAAVLVARRFGVSAAALAERLATVTPVPGRLEPQWFGAFPEAGVQVIHDAYNANPESLIDALATLAALPIAAGQRRVVVFGDMLELGDQTASLHREAAARLSDLVLGDQVQRLILIGRHTLATAAALPAEVAAKTRVHPRWSDGLADQVAADLQAGDRVLLKASRGMHFEQLLPAIAERFEPQPQEESSSVP